MTSAVRVCTRLSSFPLPRGPQPTAVQRPAAHAASPAQIAHPRSMAAATEGWPSEARHQRHHSLHF
eukprot:11080473-Lingulodinium_polyedra.AAC.1